MKNEADELGHRLLALLGKQPERTTRISIEVNWRTIPTTVHYFVEHVQTDEEGKIVIDGDEWVRLRVRGILTEVQIQALLGK